MGNTLWEEGRSPGRQVTTLAVLAALTVVLVDLAVTGELSFVFDLAFVTVCVAAAMLVRPRDFFVVGVLPPLLMLGTVLLVAATARGSIAEPVDGLVQAVVSGLAHHAGALVVGYGLTLGIIALRQVVTRESGARRPPAHQRRRSLHVG